MNSQYFRMRGLTQYYHQIALIPETGSLLLRGLDKRAGGIHNLRICGVQHVLVSLRDPVRPDDYRSSIHRFYRFHQVYSTRYQLLDYGWIVYERPQSLDWLLCVFRRLVGDLEGTFHTPTIASVVRHVDPRMTHPDSTSA